MAQHPVIGYVVWAVLFGALFALWLWLGWHIFIRGWHFLLRG